MQVIRTILWIALTAILVTFIAMNWTTVPVNFWPLSDGNYIHFEWPVGVVALVFFGLGAVPMWLLHRARRWQYNRRITALESSVRSVSVAPPPSLPELAPGDPAPLTTPVPNTTTERPE
ncbi:LapA family protein [Novosphingobium album (ex Liu et al. 2023)]|uniref:LapA family protein n=1 Tax=Novosphingobium album (ex Liu et al. 2023) TaxID=3031130 RepID=A0ABT5WNE5_9SPHN|nr:LapA family protein [Novosphingobium album (ex Liu et al. 2023)]MDE8651557.1 LapA family protein [Novosphingobium album (ex Liu et al. 2023)]